jgi:hypothetical protein
MQEIGLGERGISFSEDARRALVRRLREIAPTLTWSVTIGEASFDYGTKEFPWGHKLPALLIDGANQKGKRTPEHGKHYRDAIAWIDANGGQREGTTSIAAFKL